MIIIARRPVTYLELFEYLKTLPECELRDLVTIYDVTRDEFVGVDSLCVSGAENDVLDDAHIYMTINDHAEILS